MYYPRFERRDHHCQRRAHRGLLRFEQPALTPGGFVELVYHHGTAAGFCWVPPTPRCHYWLLRSINLRRNMPFGPFPCRWFCSYAVLDITSPVYYICGVPLNGSVRAAAPPCRSTNTLPGRPVATTLVWYVTTLHRDRGAFCLVFFTAVGYALLRLATYAPSNLPQPQTTMPGTLPCCHPPPLRRLWFAPLVPAAPCPPVLPPRAAYRYPVFLPCYLRSRRDGLVPAARG